MNNILIISKLPVKQFLKPTLCFSPLKGYLRISTAFNLHYKNTCRLITVNKASNINSIMKRSVETNSQMKPFRFSDYDCIGFDLDNTICEYKIKPMAQMEYDVLSRYLVERKGYDSKFLYTPLSKEDVDFMQRGLLLDFEKGNILKLGENGEIIKGSHGTRELAEEDLKLLYGESKLFEYTKQLCDDLTCAWDEKLKTKFRLLLDYFDLPASLGFARAIDMIDAQGGSDYTKVGEDIISSLGYMYHRNHFGTEESDYFKQLKAHPEKYINKCSEEFIDWLKDVCKSKKLFLITGSNIDYASFTSSYCLGKDWNKLFSVIVCYARKPGFFLYQRPFLGIDGLKEADEVANSLLQLNNIYSQGNWLGLHSVLCQSTPSGNSRLLYIGDNVVEDIYTPQKNLLCDTLAICEELSAEKIWDTSNEHPSYEYLVSNRWGSFFNDTNGNSTLWGSVIKRCAKLCLPSVNILPKLHYNENVESCKHKLK